LLAAWPYRIQLILGLLLTVVSVLVGNGHLAHQWRVAALGLGLSLGAIVSVETILSPQVYDQTNLTSQNILEQNLRIALEKWSGDVVVGSKNASATGIHGRSKKFCPPWRLFMKRRKDSSADIEEIDNGRLCDDHYSFLDGTSYIELRINPLIDRYRSRIPMGIFFQHFWHICNILLGVAIAIITFLVKEESGSTAVTILTACIAVSTSWIEFKDKEIEANLLSGAIQDYRNQVYKWVQLTKFMAQSRDTTHDIVIEVEEIANQVVSS